MRFRYSCVHAGSRLDELLYIIDHMRPSTHRTWKKYCGDTELGEKELSSAHDLPPGTAYPRGRKWYNMHGFEFFKSRLPDGRPVYGFVWSAIEHIYY